MRAFPIASIANLSLSLSAYLFLSLCMENSLDKSLINEVGRKVDDLRHVMNRGMTLWQNVLCPRIVVILSVSFESLPSCCCCCCWLLLLLFVVVVFCCLLLLLLLFVVVVCCFGGFRRHPDRFLCGRDIVCENWVSHIHKERRVRKKEKKENLVRGIGNNDRISRRI